MAILEITKENFEEEIKKSDKPILIDFWAEWCGYCKMQTPILENLGDENKNLKICKINVDNEPELSIEFKAMNLPLLVYMKDGEVISKVVGLHSKEEILEIINE